MATHTTARQPLEKMAGEATNGFPRVETLYMDGFGCIPFSVRGAASWKPVSLDHPARIVLDNVNQPDGYKIERGTVLMTFPKLNYEYKKGGLKAVLGDPDFIG